MGAVSLFAAFSRALHPPQQRAAVSPVNASSLRGWNTIFSSGGELNPGDFQADRPIPWNRALSYFAVYACMTQIATDIAKMCQLLLEAQDDGTWLPIENSAYSPLLRKPNHYQNAQQFIELWLLSKLSRGNALILLERDNAKRVRAMYLINWDLVTVLVADDGSVLYEIRTDDLSHVFGARVVVPASEVIHDRMNCLFHPLIGVSPLFACGLAARQGLEMQGNSAQFFQNMSRPSGILVAPTEISDEDAERLSREWQEKFGSGKIGRVAVLGDGLKYEALSVTPVDSMIVDQLKLSALQVCSTFKVPPFMIGIGDMPGFENVQSLTQFYYNGCLQTHIEAIEHLESDALGLVPTKLQVCFDLDELLRMDTKTQADVEGMLVQRGIAAPNESRKRFNRPPVRGGDSPYLQQQNYSLEDLARRSESPDPFAAGKPAAPPPAPNPAPDAAAQEEARAARAEAQRANDAAADAAQKRQEALQRAGALEAELSKLLMLAAIRERADALLGVHDG